MYLKKLKGLQNFYLNALIKSKSFLISYSFLLVIPFLVVLSLHFGNMTLYESSYIYIMVLLIAFFINTITISIKLFANQIIDFTDVTLVSKAVSRNKIFINKTFVCFLFLFISFFIQSILAIVVSALFFINTNEILSYWLITFFGQIIVALIIVPIIFYFNYTFSKIIALTSSLILLVVLILTSFLSHFVFPNSAMNNQLVNNDTYKMSYSKLIGLDQNGNQVNQELIIKQNASNSVVNENVNYKTNLNNVSIANNFMPGEWITSPFQSMYMATNYSEDLKTVAQVALDKYKYGIVRFYNQSLVPTTNLIQNLTYLPIRVEDTSIFNLNQYDLTNLLTNDIKQIISSKTNTIDFSSPAQVQNFLTKINNENLVWDQIFSPIEINSISALVGINGDYPNLYYAFKYQDLLRGKLSGWFNEIALQVSQSIADIYQGLFNNYQAYIAILYNNGYSNNFSDNKYPSINVFNDATSPSKEDLDYFKNILVTWNLTTPSLLLNDNSRRTIDLTNLSFQGNTFNIGDKTQWTNFIDANATSLINLKNIYSSLSTLATTSGLQIKTINYEPNYFDLSQYSYVANVGQQTWIENAYIYMIFIILISIVVNIYVYKRYCKKDF